MKIEGLKLTKSKYQVLSQKDDGKNSDKTKFPPIMTKRFGRKRDHLSTRGYGRRGPNNEWIDLSHGDVSILGNTSINSSLNMINSSIRPSNDDNQEISNSSLIGNLNHPLPHLEPILESHPTRIFTEKLQLSGYDRRRHQAFCGLLVDSQEYMNENLPKNRIL